MDASYKIQRGIHVHLIQFFMCPEFWVHIKNAIAFCFNFFVIPLYRADGCSGTVSLIAVVIHAWHQEKET